MFTSVSTPVRLSLAACLFLGLCLKPVSATTRYVNASARGTIHDGASWETAFLKVGDALSAANASDEVWVAAGVYLERLTVVRPVYLFGGFAGVETQREQRAPNVYVTVLDGNHAGTVLTVADPAVDGVLDGFTVCNGNAGTSADGGAIASSGASWTIRHNVFHDNSGRYGGAISLRSGHPTIVGNVFWKNSASVGGGAAYCSRTTAAFTNNTFAANYISGGSSQHSGAMDAYLSTVTFVNNIVAYNVSGGIDKDHSSGSTYVFRNNGVFGNGTYDYPTSDNPGSANGNVRTNPRFVNRTAGDFRLSAASRCIDAGDDTVVAAQDTDLDGQQRIQSLHVDIGAYEFAGPRIPLAIPRVFVRTTGNDDNDGTSWAKSRKSVQGALDDALAPGGEVWVSAGTYSETLVQWAGVSLYGGFAGTETSLDQRNPSTYVTAINANNLGCAIFIPGGAGPDTVLDGFTIAYGKGYTIAKGKTAGGSVYCADASPVIRHNKITGGSATQGAVYCSGSTAPVIEYNNFSSNSATGVFCVNGANATITANTFGGNSASASLDTAYGSPTGGGVYAYKCSPVIRGNTFSGNSGGAVGGIQSDAVIIGNTFRQNTGTTTSAGITWSVGNPQITHNTFFSNETDSSGGGLSGTFTGGRIGDNVFTGNVSGYYGGGMFVSGPVVVANNTVVGNSLDAADWYNYHAGGIGVGTGSPVLVNNLVAYNWSGIATMGGLGGTPVLRGNCVYGNGDSDFDGLPDPTGVDGNIKADPKLAAYAYGEVHIQPNSPCRDTGDDTFAEVTGTDMDGQPRIVGSHVDIGADESDGSATAFAPYVVRVSTNGSDNNDGSSWAMARQSIWGAIYSVVSHGGGDVWVAEGVYSGTTLLPMYPFCHIFGGFGGTEASLEQRDPVAHPTRIAGTDPNPTIVAIGGAIWCTVDGFTIGNAGTHGMDCWPGARPVVSNNVFTGFTGAASPYGRVAIYIREGARPSITRNTFLNNTFSAAAITATNAAPIVTFNVFSGNTSAYGGGAISVGGGRGVEVADNLFYGNTGTLGGGIAWLGSFGRIVDNVMVNNNAPTGGGIYVESPTTRPEEATLIANNTIAANTATDGGGIAVAMGAKMVTIANNVVAFNTSGLFAGGMDDMPDVHANCLFANAAYDASGVTPGASNILSDPRFMNRAGADYHLQTDSPCIDNGDSALIRVLDVDMDGQPRWSGRSVDIGAYEVRTGRPFTVADVASALHVAGGMSAASPAEHDMWNRVLTPPSTSGVDVQDAVRLIRMACGLDPNGG